MENRSAICQSQSSKCVHRKVILGELFIENMLQIKQSIGRISLNVHHNRDVKVLLFPVNEVNRGLKLWADTKVIALRCITHCSCEFPVAMAGRSGEV